MTFWGHPVQANLLISPGFQFGRSPDAFVGGDGVHGVLDVGDLRWSVLIQVSPE